MAQLVEQWPFKPLAVSSSLTRVTRRQIPVVSQEKPHFIVGLFVSILFIHIHSLSNKGHKIEGHTHKGVWDFRLQR